MIVGFERRVPIAQLLINSRVTQQVPGITSLNNERVGIGKVESPGLVAMLSECTRDRYKSIAEPATGLPSPRPLI